VPVLSGVSQPESETGYSPPSNIAIKIYLTPWRRGLLEKLTVSQLVKKFPAFYGTRRIITSFTRAPHLSLY
jgi:hypothetical protein